MPQPLNTEPQPLLPTPWRHSTDGPWSVTVPAAPSEDHRTAFFDTAVPALAAHGKPATTWPVVIAGHITAAGRPPGGPTGRVKAFLDALHDDRKSGPRYHALRVPAPLPDDTPRYVGGLALEVRPGPPQTRYLIGHHLHVAGQLLANVPVHCPAPNDIAGTPGEKAHIAAARQAFAEALQAAFARHDLPDIAKIRSVVVRHHPQRDEDNTWHTWITAICGSASNTGAQHWAHGAPLAGWRPTAIASIADTTINSPVRYELWG
jgi:hypothetical protein